jgi:hypothetical protein
VTAWNYWNNVVHTRCSIMQTGRACRACRLVLRLTASFSPFEITWLTQPHPEERQRHSFLNHFVLCSNTGANELPYKRAEHLGFSQNNDGLKFCCNTSWTEVSRHSLGRSMPSQDSALPSNRLRTPDAVCHIVTIQIPPCVCKHYWRTTGNEGDVSAARTHNLSTLSP